MIQALKEAKKDAAIFSEDKSIFVAVTDKTSNIVTKKFNSIIDMANPSKKSWQKFGWFQGISIILNSLRTDCSFLLQRGQTSI